MKIQISSRSFVVDPNISFEVLFSKFQRICPEAKVARGEPVPWKGDPYTIQVVLILIGEPIGLYEGLMFVKNQMKHSRFLSLFELASFNLASPNIQMRFPIITPKFVLWPTPDDLQTLHCRLDHGNVISPAQSFESCVFRKNPCFATTFMTDVEDDTFETTILPSLQAPPVIESAAP